MLIRFLVFVSSAALLGCLGCKSKPSEDSKVDIDKVIANAPQFPIGHRVRVIKVPQTESSGIAGRIGNLAGFTTPSRTGIEILGVAEHDIAFNVTFQNPDDSAWLAPEYLEFIGRTSALEIDIYGKRWSWRAEGTLNQRPQEQEIVPSQR
jgi:RNase P/RNase MRP subunit p29